MKYLVLFLFFFSNTFSVISSCPFVENCDFISISDNEQQIPFSFFNPVPPVIRTTDRADLSFSVNNAIVNQYRYMLVVPDPEKMEVSRSLLNWSSWKNNAFTDIIITKLSQEGKYTLVIEYRVYGSLEARRFERSFEVQSPSAGSAVKGGNTDAGTNTAAGESTLGSDPEAMLAEALEKKDKALLMKSLQGGAGLNFKGEYGGNIYHLLNDSLVDNQLMDILGDNGFGINEKDSLGNTPLHIAVMSREREYTRALLNHKANPDILNNIELAPLHLAAFLNDAEAARDILDKGAAKIDIIGNSGYTPLHIASLMNNIEVVRDLVNIGAETRIKTVQKLNSRQIAGIQDNKIVKKIVGSDGRAKLNKNEISTIGSLTRMDQVKLNPQFDVNLLYNKELLKKRKQAKVAGIISVPVFAV
ncbi:MAG: ankyrin repeat domain-containing protein, partial [Bacteroidales bacterium]|nr:ankyrin repeat domain-containing protein [Bacteroidales bacterium]